MDALYYIGGGSMRQNEELRYSLRALEKHCKDIDKVWVVGNKPPFLNNNVKYLWVEDVKGKWYQNAIKKTVAAIEAGISDKFLLMNDDFFMLEDFEAGSYPAYHKGELPDVANRPYTEVLVNTKKLLKQLGKPTKHYGVHCPMVIEKDKYLALKQYFDDPVSIRCLYGNFYLKGRKVNDNKGTEIKTSATKCFSTKDYLNDEIYQKLQELFPEPSKWEK